MGNPLLFFSTVTGMSRPTNILATDLTRSLNESPLIWLVYRLAKFLATPEIIELRIGFVRNFLYLNPQCSGKIRKVISARLST